MAESVCIYCGGEIGFVGVYQKQYRYVCLKCKKLQRSLGPLVVKNKIDKFIKKSG